MTRHARTDDLIALRMGALSGDESRELLNHIATCAMCQREAQEVLDVRADAREVATSLARDEARPRPMRWLAAAAAVAAAALTLPLLLRDEPSPPEPPPVAATAGATTAPPPPTSPARPAKWEAIVRETLAAGTIAQPALLVSLQPTADEFRAWSGEHGGIPDMRPFGEIVESDRPLFRWPKTAGATYTVLVGERGRIVAQSPPLDDNRWRCAVALPRDRTYRWQVEVRAGDRTSIVPMPPAPSARFHVLDAAAKAQLDEARRAAPDDRLLLGILAARAGLRDEALAHFEAVSGADAARADALREGVLTWRATR